MFDRIKRARNQDGTFKKDVWWTPWSDSWEYKMSEELKDMIERTAWTFIEAFIGALTVAHVGPFFRSKQTIISNP